MRAIQDSDRIRKSELGFRTNLPCSFAWPLDTTNTSFQQLVAPAVLATDTVARLGGAEFVLVIESIDERGQVVALCGSVGFAWYPRDGDNLKDILDVADQAMYSCKTSGLMPLS